jgi:hypothetical protein
MRYDANKAPDPKKWRELDEWERLELVIEYHRLRRLPVGQSIRAQLLTSSSKTRPRWAT